MLDHKLDSKCLEWFLLHIFLFKNISKQMLNINHPFWLSIFPHFMRKKNYDLNLLFKVYLEFCECILLVYQRYWYFVRLLKHENPKLQKLYLLGNVLVNLLLHNQNLILIMQLQLILSWVNRFLFNYSSIR